MSEPNTGFREFVVHDEDYEVREAKDGSDDGLIITGKAMPLGVRSRNGVIYEPESVRKTAEAMEGNSFLVNHDFDMPVGHVRKFQPTEDGVVYEVNVDPQSKMDDGVTLARKIERGDVRHVSIHAMGEVMDHEDAVELDAIEDPDDEVVVLEVSDFLELSAVTVPGFTQTSMSPEGGAQAVTVSELRDQHLKTQQKQKTVSELVHRVDYDEAVETSWEAPDVEDFKSFDEYAQAHSWWETENPQETEDVSLPIARPNDDGGYEVVYEALNSAHDLASRVVSDEGDLKDLREYLEAVREEEFSDREPLDADEEGFEEQIPVPLTENVQVLYPSEEQANRAAEELGLDASNHAHSLDGEEYYMPGESHDEFLQAIRDMSEESLEQASYGFDVGDFVRWEFADGSAVGEIVDRENEPGQGFTVDGGSRDATEEEPVYLIEEFDDEQGEYTDDVVKSESEIQEAERPSGASREIVEDVDLVPTDEMAEIASTALEKIDDSDLDNDECATRTGLERANQLENKESLSPSTVNRMVSFFARHDGNQQVETENKWEDCGFVSWQLWGGDPGREWAERKQRQLDDEEETMKDNNQEVNQSEAQERIQRYASGLSQRFEPSEDEFQQALKEIEGDMQPGDDDGEDDERTHTDDEDEEGVSREEYQELKEALTDLQAKYDELLNNDSPKNTSRTKTTESSGVHPALGGDKT